MTRAFIEPIILKPENEKYIREAFLKKNQKRVEEFNKNQTKNRTKRLAGNKLSLSDLL
ncbi:hypothetical protein [Sulfuricurvum sp.]|uniref:hypothetical protein n=1 Tax=Sulfuricurvum sp. TaxID=2025608 RepID=UPI00356758FC